MRIFGIEDFTSGLTQSFNEFFLTFFGLMTSVAFDLLTQLCQMTQSGALREGRVCKSGDQAFWNSPLFASQFLKSGIKSSRQFERDRFFIHRLSPLQWQTYFPEF